MIRCPHRSTGTDIGDREITGADLESIDAPVRGDDGAEVDGVKPHCAPQVRKTQHFAARASMVYSSQVVTLAGVIFPWRRGAVTGGLQHPRWAQYPKTQNRLSMIQEGLLIPRGGCD